MQTRRRSVTSKRKYTLSITKMYLDTSFYWHFYFTNSAKTLILNLQTTSSNTHTHTQLHSADRQVHTQTINRNICKNIYDEGQLYPRDWEVCGQSITGLIPTDRQTDSQAGRGTGFPLPSISRKLIPLRFQGLYLEEQKHNINHISVP